MSYNAEFEMTEKVERMTLEVRVIVTMVTTQWHSASVMILAGSLPPGEGNREQELTLLMWQS